MLKSPSAIAQHIESGGCSPKITRHHITRAVQSLNIIPTISVNHRVEGGSSSSRAIITYQATGLAWNGSGYECYLCHRTFHQLSSLNAHLSSPAHDDVEFQCPNRKCRRQFTLVSGLIQHIESEVCGVTKFQDVKDRMLDFTAQFTKALTW
ncbi:hypothetical protein DL96DRAFT_1741729 [Flagelloscypha sp. PMI_526]|nr:hypothetical protein DL96DRAFT_1741729 [Flagelloscypha sp. PMI_526]